LHPKTSTQVDRFTDQRQRLPVSQDSLSLLHGQRAESRDGTETDCQCALSLSLTNPTAYICVLQYRSVYNGLITKRVCESCPFRSDARLCDLESRQVRFDLGHTTRDP
jgi:hypothetical protein